MLLFLVSRWQKSWMQYWIMEKLILLRAAQLRVVTCPSLSKSYVLYMIRWQRSVLSVLSIHPLIVIDHVNVCGAYMLTWFWKLSLVLPLSLANALCFLLFSFSIMYVCSFSFISRISAVPDYELFWDSCLLRKIHHEVTLNTRPDYNLIFLLIYML